MKHRKIALALVALAFAGVGALAIWPLLPHTLRRSGELAAEPSRAAFVECADRAGFRHVHHKPNLDPKLDPIRNWVASVGAAAAAADFDGDGRVDLYVTDSLQGAPNHLYRNRGDGTFEDVAERAGVAWVNDATGICTDCVWGDWDNDGRPDLFLTKWGRNQLFRNEGDGRFRDVTAEVFRDETGKPGAPWANACAAIWVDYDGDAKLDLYVGNYFAPWNLFALEHTRVMHDSFEQARNAGRNALWHQNGDGTFTDVAAQLGLDDPGWTLAVGHGDVDNDGWPDIYCADDFGPDQLYMNRGDGTFRDVTAQVLGADTKKGMNVDFGDYDNDGWLDIQVANITTAEYLREGNMLWHNLGPGADGLPRLVDVASEAGVWDGGWGWGAKWLDFDNDGDLDLIGLNGFVTAGEGEYWFDLASWTVTRADVAEARAWPPMGERSFSGRELTRLWRNGGKGRFAEVALRMGLDDRHDGRGAALLDYDNDGDLDVYCANQGQPPTFFENRIGSAGHWLELRLIGRPAAGSNRDAIGARVSIVTAAGLQVRELDGGNGYCAQSDRRLHFGLGPEPLVRTLEIRWPSRRVQVLHDVRGDRLLEIEEPEVLPPSESLIPRRREDGAQVQVVAPATAAPPIPAAEAEALLADLERVLREQPDDVALGSRYRAQCVRLARHERAARFLAELVQEKPASRNLRLQLAAAYVDLIPTCGGLAAVVSKGTFARRSLDELDALLEQDPDWWPAVYCRAMNHLHWPRALRHSASAAADFRRCVELQERPATGAARAWYVRSHIGLGDALAKDGQIEAARSAWRAGLERFSDSAALRERLAIAGDDALRAFIERERSLERPIDTDFSFLIQD